MYETHIRISGADRRIGQPAGVSKISRYLGDRATVPDAGERDPYTQYCLANIRAQTAIATHTIGSAVVFATRDHITGAEPATGWQRKYLDNAYRRFRRRQGPQVPARAHRMTAPSVSSPSHCQRRQQR